MKINALLLTTVLALCSCLVEAQERSSELLTGWEFRRDHNITAADGWQEVRIPHDWAITGPFDRANDLQEVAIVQNNEETATVKTGRSGGLPYVGKGCYRRTIDIDGDALAGGYRYILLFDGAMSEARVLVNGREVCYWPYGYNSFHCDITDVVKAGSNDLAVLLENRPQSSRWYPGAGLYRKVRLLCVPEVHVPVWGTYVTTPYVGKDYACVSVRTEIEGVGDGDVITLKTVIFDRNGREAASSIDTRRKTEGMPFEQQLIVDDPDLWSPETPSLYTVMTEVYTGGAVETDWTGRHKITVSEGSELQDTVRQATDEEQFSQLVTLMQNAKEQLMNTDDIPAVVHTTSRAFGITDTEQSGVFTRLMESNDLSLYGLANAVTRHSQDIESYDRATDLEGIGYNILSMPLRQWTGINQAAA